MTTLIDETLALQLLQRAIEEKGADFVYARPESGNCQYQVEGQPSCIVGHALSYIGLGDHELEQLDTRYESTAIDEVDPILWEYGVELDEDAMTLWTKVQKNQDFGQTWGDAVAAALAEIKGGL